MILLLGDLHADYGIFREHVKRARKDWQVDSIVQAGDLGIWERYWPHSPRIDIPMYFIEGNHESFPLLEKLRKGRSGVVALKRNYYHVERGSTFELGGLKWVGLGGCEMFSPPNCPPGSTFTDQEIQKAASVGPVDVVLTHDGPYGLRIPGHPAFGGGIDVGCARLEPLYALQPKLWIFAHHHQQLQVRERDVQHFCLDVANLGYGLLDPSTLQIAWRSYNGSS